MLKKKQINPFSIDQISYKASAGPAMIRSGWCWLMMVFCYI